MRPSYILSLFFCALFLFDASLYIVHSRNNRQLEKQIFQMLQLVQRLGLSDLAVSTEARYTRHPAVSDPVVPFMDHPGSFEHFPSGSFWVPPVKP